MTPYSCMLTEIVVGLPPFSGPSNTLVTLSDNPPTSSALSTPPPSPSSLGFASACINPNPVDNSSDLPSHPSSLDVNNPLPSSSTIAVYEPLITPHSFAPPSGSYLNIPPLSDTLPSNPPPPPEERLDSGYNTDWRGDTTAETRPRKKSRCYRTKVEDIILRLGEDI